MPTAHAEIFGKLAAPFPNAKQRSGGRAGSLTYITARQAMNRLDEVLGPENWWDRIEVTEKGAICSISISLPDGTVITKSDGGGGAAMEDDDNEFKSMMSDAFKRAAVKFGIGRYLYQDGVPPFAGPYFEGTHAAATQGYSTPPAGAHPAGGGNGGGPGRAPDYNCPRSGKALFAWMKDREAEFNFCVLDAVNRHPAISGHFPQRMTEWNDQQVAYGYHVMKELWQKAGKWPAGAGNSPGEVEEAAGAPGALAGPEASPEELRALKGKIRETFVKLVKVENPSVDKVTIQLLMGRINVCAAARGFQMQMEELRDSRDVAKLRMVLADGEAALAGAGGDEIPF